MGLLPPDSVSYHLLNGKRVKSNLFHAAAWQEAEGSRDTILGWKKASVSVEAGHWSSGDKVKKHLLVDGMQSGSSFFSLLHEWPGIRDDVRWLSRFHLCNMFGTICLDKSVASFGNETRWLGFVGAKAFEIYTVTFLHYIFC